MQNLPHIYSASVASQPEGHSSTSAAGVAPLTVAAPAEFGGPGDQWSPESLLMASVANCLVLSFKAIAAASRLEWLAIECESQGELDKVERQIKFTQINSKATLRVASPDLVSKAERLLHKAEETCFISNSLSCDSQLSVDVIVG